MRDVDNTKDLQKAAASFPEAASFSFEDPKLQDLRNSFLLAGYTALTGIESLATDHYYTPDPIITQDDLDRWAVEQLGQEGFIQAGKFSQKVLGLLQETRDSNGGKSTNLFGSFICLAQLELGNLSSGAQRSNRKLMNDGKAIIKRT